MVKGLTIILLTLALHGCAGMGVSFNECPVIPDTILPCKIILDESTALPGTPEEATSAYLRLKVAYLDCVDAIAGYREILQRAREGE